MAEDQFIHAYARTGDTEAIRKLLNEDTDVNSRGMNAFTPLHLAAARNHVDIVNLLLAHGADVNAAGWSGCTPLHATAVFDCRGSAEALVAAGAAIEAQLDTGETPLRVASLWSWVNHTREVAVFLLSRRAAMTIADAVFLNLAREVGLFLDSGVDPNLEVDMCSPNVACLALVLSGHSGSASDLYRLVPEEIHLGFRKNGTIFSPKYWSHAFGECDHRGTLLYAAACGRCNDVGSVVLARMGIPLDEALLEATMKAEDVLVEFFLNHGARPDGRLLSTAKNWDQLVKAQSRDYGRKERTRRIVKLLRAAMPQGAGCGAFCATAGFLALVLLGGLLARLAGV